MLWIEYEYVLVYLSYVHLCDGPMHAVLLINGDTPTYTKKTRFDHDQSRIDYKWVKRRTKWLSRFFACVSSFLNSCFFSDGIEIAGSITIYGIT